MALWILQNSQKKKIFSYSSQTWITAYQVPCGLTTNDIALHSKLCLGWVADLSLQWDLEYINIKQPPNVWEHQRPPRSQQTMTGFLGQKEKNIAQYGIKSSPSSSKSSLPTATEA